MAAPPIQRCTQCGRVARPTGPALTCPYCGAKMSTTAPPPGTSPVAPPGPATPAAPSFAAPAPAFGAPASQPPLPEGVTLPERMKANKVLSGRVCPGCAKPIELGNDVRNCPTCNGTMHLSCYESAKQCLLSSCPTRNELTLQPVQPADGGGHPAAVTGDAKPCPYCGEQIAHSARKCRFCGEYLNAADRARQDRQVAQSTADDNLTTAEILFGVLCSGIACIFGLVWLLQGKKKGGKLMAIAIVTNIIVRILLEISQSGR